MIVVSNTSPMTNLAAIGQVALLRQLYGGVYIPEAVYRELRAGESRGDHPPFLELKGVGFYTNRAGGVYNCPPPAGSPRFARGTEPRVHAVPPASRGNLKEGVFSRACFHKLCPRGW